MFIVKFPVIVVVVVYVTLSDNSLRQTVHTRRASVQAKKLVAAFLRVARVICRPGGK